MKGSTFLYVNNTNFCDNIDVMKQQNDDQVHGIVQQI